LAEFMGYTVYDRYPRNHGIGPAMETEGVPPYKPILRKNIKYHKSWDALIPVVVELCNVPSRCEEVTYDQYPVGGVRSDQPHRKRVDEGGRRGPKHQNPK